MIREAIRKVVAGTDLTEEEMVHTMNEVMTGAASPAQIASFITALRLKGETVDEIRAGRLMHGKTSLIHHDGKTIFKGIPNPFEATRYHSLIVKKDTMPDCLEMSAWTVEGEIMGIRHKEYPVEGVQFHPESILTKAGKDLLKNFIRLVG